MKKIVGGLLLLLLAVGDLARVGAGEIKSGHPRLLATADDWEKIKKLRATDPLLEQFIAGLHLNAEAALTMPPLSRVKDGRRILQTSRAVFARVLTLAAVYRLDGSQKFAGRAIREMESAAEFADWNPEHFLDAAELCTGLALGYDWLYEEMTAEQRAKIRAAIIGKALEPGLTGKRFWHNSTNNWNSVCWGGLTLGALAVAEDEPELAKQVLVRARAGLPLGMKAYAPEGVYPEGPMYWTYGTTYLAITIAALESALGTDWELSSAPGFRASAEWLARETTATGRYFNFSDGREEASFNTALFWFAKDGGEGVLYGQKPALKKLLLKLRGLPLANMVAIDRSKPENEKLDMAHFLPLTLVWWQTMTGAEPRFAKDAAGLGSNPVVVFRSSWNDPRGLYLGVKGGSAAVSHGHMDAGSFVFECRGVRWAMDLGLQDYNSLEKRGVDIWGDGRWSVFRLNNFSHNTLTVNGRLHNLAGKAVITGFDAAVGTTMVDLTPTFKGQAESVTRGFQVIGRNGVSVSDRLTGLKAGDTVTWRMLTPAVAELAVDGKILLRQDGKVLAVDYTVSGGTVQPTLRLVTTLHDYDVPNPGVTEVTLTVTAAGGDEPVGIETMLTVR
jgi:hypothetical protein